MRFIFTGLIATVLATASFGQSAASPTPTADSLRKTFDACNDAIKAKNFQGVLSQMSSATRKQIAAMIPPAQHTPFFLNAMLRVPISYEVESVAPGKDGKSASLMLLAMLPPIPPDMQESEKSEAAGQPRKRELTVVFAREAGLWKISAVNTGIDPDQRPRPKDLKMGQRADYNAESNTDMGGVIQRIEKQDAGTVYVIRILDEEDAVFVPADHVSPDFVTGVVISFHAAQNQNDPLKYWAESAKLEK
jgi:hypothetical protein